MIDGITDLLTAILVLAIVAAVGFGLLMPLLQTDLMSYDSSIEDKAMLSTSKDYSDEVSGLIVPTKRNYSAREVVLVTQVQDTCMPNPRMMKVYDTDNTTVLYTLNIFSTYKQTAKNDGLLLWRSLPDIVDTAKYTLDYGYGVDTDISDDSYEIRKVE